MDFKELTKKTFNDQSEEFEEYSKDYIKNFLSNDLNLFLNKLRGKKILDLGSGPGRDSAIFKKKGFCPICVDFSREMIKKCQKKGLRAIEVDFESLPFNNNSFDGIWAYASLLHLPKKDFEKMLEKIKELLTMDGLFYIGMREGNFDGVRNFARTKNKVQFSFYNREELENHLNKFFNIIHFSKIKKGKYYTYLNFLCETQK